MLTAQSHNIQICVWEPTLHCLEIRNCTQTILGRAAGWSSKITRNYLYTGYLNASPSFKWCFHECWTRSGWEHELKDLPHSRSLSYRLDGADSTDFYSKIGLNWRKKDLETVTLIGKCCWRFQYCMCFGFGSYRKANATCYISGCVVMFSGKL